MYTCLFNSFEFAALYCYKIFKTETCHTTERGLRNCKFNNSHKNKDSSTSNYIIGNSQLDARLKYDFLFIKYMQVVLSHAR